MKIERARNASRNIVFGAFLKLYQILLPFVMRTIMVYTIGVQYLGLNSLFTSILQTLNLAELGVGSAMVFSMYKPIADDDHVTICALMKLYRLYYRIIGIVILAAGIALLPFIPKLISGDVPEDINIYALYFLNLLATVFTYWLFAYKNSVINAHQRLDIISKVTLITDTVKYIIQISALIIFKSYYIYVIAILFTQIMMNVITAICSQRMFPQFNPKGKLPKKSIKVINRRIKDLFTAKLGGTIVSSADTIVISAFLGLRLLAVYQNYYYILSSVMAFISIINSSITAGVGNSLITKSVEENHKDFKVFTLLSIWLNGFCICCFAALYQPFMKIWMGEDMLLDYSLVIMLCALFFGNSMVQQISVYKDAGGIWNKDRFRPLISGILNLGVNLLLVRFIGLYGIVLSTIISIFAVSLPWIIINVYTLIFNCSPIAYIRRFMYYVVVIIISAVLTYILSGLVPGDGVIALAAKGIICCIISNICFILAYIKLPEFNNAKRLMIKMIPFIK